MAYDWGKLIDVVYQSTLRRDPQQAGRNYWIKDLQNKYQSSLSQGMNEGQAYGAASQHLLNSIMGGSEWKDAGVPTDISGLNEKINKLTKENVNLTDQVNNPYSDEDWNNLLNRSYQTAFNRDIGAEGKSYWGPQVRQQYEKLIGQGWSKDAAFGLSSQWLYKGLSASDEYKDANPDSIAAKYQALLDKEGTPTDLNWDWNSLIDSTYQTFFKRAAGQEGLDYWGKDLADYYQTKLTGGASEQDAYGLTNQYFLQGLQHSPEWQGIYGPTVNKGSDYVGGSGGGGTQIVHTTPQTSKTAGDQAVEQTLDTSASSIGSGAQRKKYNVGGGTSSLNIPTPSAGGLGIT